MTGSESWRPPHSHRACASIWRELTCRHLKTSHSLTLAPALIEHPTLRYFTFARSVLSLVNDMIPSLAKAYPKYNLDLRATAKGLQKTETFKHILVLHLEHGEQWLERCTQAGLANE